MALILDTNVLFASLDRTDAAHTACRRLIDSATEALLIPAPVLPELDYMISQRLYPAVMVAFIADIIGGAYEIVDLHADDYERVGELIDRYADSDIGFVDAAILAITERLNEPKLATLDRRHFGLMRPRHVAALELLPA